MSSKKYRNIYIKSVITEIMSKLKELYVGKIGHDYERIRTESWYLSQLALEGALEIDSYLQGKNNNFSHAQELTDILEKYKLKDNDTCFTEPYFPYLPLWRTMRKSSDKDLRTYSELALEIKLFVSELKCIPNSNNLEEVSSVLCDLSREFLSEFCGYSRRLAA